MSTLLHEEMRELKNTSIFKEFSTGLSCLNLHKENPCIITMSCSPSDGVELIFESEHAKSHINHKVFFKKTMTITDLTMLKKMINEGIKFYQEECK